LRRSGIIRLTRQQLCIARLITNEFALKFG
jgi:hypothetical protein